MRPLARAFFDAASDPRFTRALAHADAFLTARGGAAPADELFSELLAGFDADYLDELTDALLFALARHYGPRRFHDKASLALVMPPLPGDAPA